MDCRAFRASYTDLLDGQLEEADEARFHEHLAACTACHRFDQAYRLGVSALQRLPCPRSSRDFTARVLHAVRADSGSRTVSFASGFAGAALVVALVGFLAIDLRMPERRGAAVSAGFGDAIVVLTSPDSGADTVGFSLRGAALIPPFWDRRDLATVRQADLSSSGALFATPAAWNGR